MSEIKPAGWMVFTEDGESLGLCHLYAADTPREVGEKILARAKREGYTGSLVKRLLDLKWTILPVYSVGPENLKLMQMMAQRAQEMGITSEEWARDVHDSILARLNRQ